MEFNRLISLVLGFIVLILAFVWLNNKFRSNPNQTTTTNKEATITLTPSPTNTKKGIQDGPLSFLFGLNDKTPTPSPSPTTTQINEENNNNYEVNVIEETSQNKENLNTNNPNVKVQILEKKNNQPTITLQSGVKNSQNSYQTATTQIPETGAASILIPTTILSLFGGVLLRRKT